MCGVYILLVLGLGDKLETSVCCFAKLGGYKLPWSVKVQTLLTNPDGDAKKWSPWESDEREEEDVVVMNEEMDKMTGAL